MCTDVKWSASVPNAFERCTRRVPARPPRDEIFAARSQSRKSSVGNCILRFGHLLRSSPTGYPRLSLGCGLRSALRPGVDCNNDQTNDDENFRASFIEDGLP